MNDYEASSPARRDVEAQEKKTRTRSGCLNCRRIRRKCDETRPACSKCRQRGEVCDWGRMITFRTDNATQLDSEHPSMQQGSRKRARQFKIVDVTSRIEKDYNQKHAADPGTGCVNTLVESVTSQTRRKTSSKNAISLQSEESNGSYPSEAHYADSPTFDTPNSMTVSYPDDNAFQADEEPYINTETSPEGGTTSYRGLAPYAYNEGSQENTSSRNEQTSVSQYDSPASRVNTEDAAADLLALRYLPAQQQSCPNSIAQILMPPPANSTIFHDEQQSGLDGDSMFDHRDGIFVPGSAYQEFHSTLRDHLLYTARSNCPTRHGTPETLQLDSGSADRLLRGVDRTESDPESARISRSSEIAPQREYLLWRAWIDEVAPWLDKFDNDRHFEHKIPMIARTTPHLKSSVLALSARQIEMKENSKSSSESLALYQEAIHLLLPDLQSKSTAVIASCVILCVLEMMSCSPNEWRRHLEGCAYLLEAVGINGFAGGVEEALFWCFARMDLCGALISQEVTLIPVNRWTSAVDFHSSIRLFRNSANGFDMYANYAVYLCANCVAYIKDQRIQSRAEEARRWLELIDLLDDWYLQRPQEMEPILTIAVVEGENNSPFPTVLYGNGPAVSGNQLYHTATLLMLQDKPAGLQAHRKQKSIFWHARQICAISESNTHHGAWTNSIQPIWIAGKVMSHPSEHKAILNILERIERELGWATAWRREDLKAWWGDSDD